MIFNSELVQLQQAIGARYTVLSADGSSDHEDYMEHDKAKRVTFVSFITTPRVIMGDVHCEEAMYMIRQEFKLNSRLMWRERPHYIVVTGKNEKQEPIELYQMRMRIGEAA